MIFLPYHSARGEIDDADVLLWRPTTRLGRLIALGGGYSHVETAVWWGDTLFSLGMVRSGGRAARLSQLVAAAPGKIDVFRPGTRRRHDYRPALTVDLVKQAVGLEYGQVALCLAMLAKVIPRRWRSPKLDLEFLRTYTPWSFPPHCCQLRIWADRAGGAAGYDPIKWTRDRRRITSGPPDERSVPHWRVEPWMFAASPYYEYQFTLRS